MSWHEARRNAAGELPDWTPEEEEARIEKMTKALRKALGATADRQPDIFRQALERFSPLLAQALDGGARGGVSRGPRAGHAIHPRGHLTVIGCATLEGAFAHPVRCINE